MKPISLLGLLLCAGLSLAAVHKAAAQNPTDAILMDKGQLCLAGLYQFDTWHQYWEGRLLRDNGNIGHLQRQTATAMAALGLSPNLNVIAALPWVHTAATAGQVRGAQGLQDWGLWLKARLWNTELGTAKLQALAVLGAGAPASNYLADFAPFNLGLGAPEASLRAIVQCQRHQGAYARAQMAYHWRGYATIERDYYYTTHGYYTDQVDVPNAITYGFTLGSWLLNNSLKAEVAYDALITQGGHDIRRQDAGFPSNRMIFTRIGGGLQYYFPKLKGLGVLATGHYILSGRNVGQSTVFTGGVLYQFGLW